MTGLAGATVIVTGGASGLGLGLAPGLEAQAAAAAASFSDRAVYASQVLGTHGSIWITTSMLAFCPAVLLLSPLRGRRDLPAAPLPDGRQGRSASDGRQERVPVSRSNAGRTSTVS